MLKTRKNKLVLLSSTYLFLALYFSANLARTVLAWDGIVPCDNVKTKCDFNAFMKLINNIINFALFYLALPLSAIMIAYAGFELVTSAGGKEKRGTAKKVFTNAVYGLVCAAGAWIIIKVILSILGYDGAWIFDRFN